MKNISIKNLCTFGAKMLVVALMGAVAFSTNVVILGTHNAEAAGMLETARIDEEILWFARTIYSETKKTEEQNLVAWVIRNRVESEYFPDTYKEVVLQKGQFSGMHPTDKQYVINVSMSYKDSSPSWDSALSIARAVYFADPVLRPIAADVLHFFSPISVSSTPSWAKGIEPAHKVTDPSTNAVRFAFYADIM